MDAEFCFLAFVKVFVYCVGVLLSVLVNTLHIAVLCDSKKMHYCASTLSFSLFVIYGKEMHATKLNLFSAFIKICSS